MRYFFDSLLKHKNPGSPTQSLEEPLHHSLTCVLVPLHTPGLGPRLQVKQRQEAARALGWQSENGGSSSPVIHVETAPKALLRGPAEKEVFPSKKSQPDLSFHLQHEQSNTMIPDKNATCNCAWRTTQCHIKVCYVFNDILFCQ